MKHCQFLILIVLFSNLVSCSNNANSAPDIMKLVGQRDSLIEVNKTLSQDHNELTSILTEVADCFDSIAVQERILVLNRTDENGRKLSRKQILANMDAFKEILARNKARIKNLQDSLVIFGKAVQLQTIINELHEKLEEKDFQIANLRKEVANNKRIISDLQDDIRGLESNIDTLTQQKVAMTNALKAQDKIINECYILIATKKELKLMNILQSNFWGNTKLDLSRISFDGFDKVDIREFKEVILNSKKPEIRTPLPPSYSYSLVKVGDKEWKLTILDATIFWQASNCLIIQL